MLLTAAVARGIADGSVDLAFRRWGHPRIRPGSSFIALTHVIEVTSMERVDPAQITPKEARRAGYESVDELRATLCVNTHNPTYRIGLRCIGEDPRIALRADDDLSDDDVADIRLRLDRMDARSKNGPWTRATLEIIGRRPGVVSTDLAAELGRDRAGFKNDVTKLKKLGLTESLEVGYALSPRGVEFCRRVDDHG
ncbi:ASCH domain-containing protein [Gordonia sp. GN26]